MKDFVKMSKYAGMREDLVQAGGGNSSFKISPDRMAIKASGFQLADVTEQDGYATVNPKFIQDAFLQDKDIESMSEEKSKQILQQAFIEGKRPSIETFLHAISGTYTLHTHPIVVNVLTCRKGGMERLAEMFPQALMVPYATPGVELAKQYFMAYKNKAIEENQIFDIVFLENHGLVVSGETAEEVIEKTESIVKKIEEYLQCNFDSYRHVTALWQYFEEKIVWLVTDQNVLKQCENNENMWAHTFCPDCIVFMGKKFLNLQDENISEQIEKFYQEYGAPIIVRYQKNLYIVADSVKKALEIQSVLSFSAQVMGLNEKVQTNLLSEQEQNFLLNWDAEKYRKNMK